MLDFKKTSTPVQVIRSLWQIPSLLQPNMKTHDDDLINPETAMRIDVTQEIEACLHTAPL